MSLVAKGLSSFGRETEVCLAVRASKLERGEGRVAEGETDRFTLVETWSERLRAAPLISVGGDMVAGLLRMARAEKEEEEEEQAGTRD